MIFTNGGLPDMPNPLLAPLDTPPFFAAVYSGGTTGTAGGLVINENAQVVRPDGDPIPGLYACGNCSCGVTGGTYVGGGVSVGSGSVMA